MRKYCTGGCGHGHVIDSMVPAARYFGGRGGQALAPRGRRDELDTGARRHHWITVGIAREGEGAVRERENHSAATHARAIDHVGTHGHGAFDSPASASTVGQSAAAGTHCNIIPQAAASSAGSLLPSKVNPSARALPTRRGKVHVPPESGSRPSFENAWTKLAERAAMTRSQASAILAPAPAATPLTAAITGMGSVCNASTKGL